jgi:large subunit ribosomal protein L17
MATLRALSTALFERERIRTTLMKAKELRPFAEKLITRSKRDDLHSRRIVMRDIQDKDVARKLFDTLSARYMERPGGYMRIFKLGRRKGDGAEMALVELLGSEPDFKQKEEDKKATPAASKKPGLAARLLGRGRGRGKAAAEPAAEGEAPMKASAEGTPEEAGKPASPARVKKQAKPRARKPKGVKKKG